MDPSKYVHGVKNLDKAEDDKRLSTTSEKLTWKLSEPTSENYKKRKGEFPKYTPPAKKKKPLFALSERSRNEEDGFEVVSAEVGGVKQSPRVQNVSRFDSDYSSGDEQHTVDLAQKKRHKAPLPDLVKSTERVPHPKQFNFSDSDSETQRPSKTAKETKGSKMKIAFSTPTSEKMKPHRNEMDSGSESDTPFASLQKKAVVRSNSPRKLTTEPPTPTKSSATKSDNQKKRKKPADSQKTAVSCPEVNKSKESPKMLKTAERKLNASTKKQKSKIGRLPGFGGTAMLDTEKPVIPVKKKPIRTFDDVKYGADILAELFASDSSDNEEGEESGGDVGEAGQQEFQELQGAINDLLGLKSRIKFGQSNVSKQTSAEKRATQKESNPNISSGDADSEHSTSDADDEGDAHENQVSSSGSVSPPENSDSSCESLDYDSDDESSEDEMQVLKDQPTEQQPGLKVGAEGSVECQSDSTDMEERNTLVSKKLPNNPAVKTVAKTKVESAKAEPKRRAAGLSTFSEFSSGLMEGATVTRGNLDFDRGSDSEDDFFDLIASGNMKKVKEFERKANMKTSKDKKTSPSKRQLENVETKEVKTPAVKEKKPVTKDLLSPKAKQSAPAELTTEACEPTKGTREHVKSKPMTKTQKHAADNEKRLESLRNKEQAVKTQQNTIKKALASIVSSPS